jgi:hypothetical protein
MALALKDFKKSVGAAVIAGSLAFTPATAGANDDNAQLASNTTPVASTTTTKAKTDPLERAIAAREYSKNNNAVGFFVTIAPGSRFTPQQIGDAMVRKFAGEEIPSAYSYNYASAGDSGIDFFVNGTPYAGYGFSKVAEGYKLVVNHYKNLQQTNEIAEKLGLERREGESKEEFRKRIREEIAQRLAK